MTQGGNLQSEDGFMQGMQGPAHELGWVRGQRREEHCGK